MRILKLFLLTILVLFGSCSTIRVYRDGSTGTLKSYTAIPEYYGEDQKKTYVSGSYTTANAEQSPFPSDQKSIVSLKAHRAHNFKAFSYYYGVGGSLGSYKFKSDVLNLIEEGETKSFFSLDTKIGGNIHKAWNAVDWRILGVELTYNLEGGPYQRKLDDLKDSSNSLRVYSNPSILAYNLSTEVIFKFDKQNTAGFGLFYGSVLNSKEEFQPKADFSGFMLNYRYSDYTLSVIYSTTGESNIEALKLGLTYILF